MTSTMGLGSETFADVNLLTPEKTLIKLFGAMFEKCIYKLFAVKLCELLINKLICSTWMYVSFAGESLCFVFVMFSANRHIRNKSISEFYCCIPIFGFVSSTFKSETLQPWFMCHFLKKLQKRIDNAWKIKGAEKHRLVGR